MLSGSRGQRKGAGDQPGEEARGRGLGGCRGQELPGAWRWGAHARVDVSAAGMVSAVLRLGVFGRFRDVGVSEEVVGHG